MSTFSIEQESITQTPDRPVAEDVVAPLPPPSEQEPTPSRPSPEIESPGRRWTGGAIAWLIAIGWFAAFHLYWTAAHSGVDQNGYLVGGRMFADHLSTGMEPPDFFGFVGRMWIGTPWQTYYPKYPIGLPILYAGLLKLGLTPIGRLIAFSFGSPKWGLIPVAIFFALRTVLEIAGPKRTRWLYTPACLTIAIAATALAVHHAFGPLGQLPVDGPSAGVNLCYLLSPLAMALALIATYQLARLVAGSFGGILAMITVACSPVTLELTNNPNSHATTLFCVTWGMFLLIRWWQSGGALRAALAGFLLGYAVTIRYTEGMLVLPILVTAIFAMKWRSKRSWVETAMLLAWWAIPVMFLVAFNLGAFGAVTGYDSTNESTGFTWEYFQANWETTVRQIYNTGLFFILPISFAGLLVMFFRSWKMALLLTSWILPSLILYTAYYWAPDGQTIGYMRFYLTIFPTLALTAFWLLVKVVPEAFATMGNLSKKALTASILAAGAFALIAVAVLLMTVGDLRYQKANPLLDDLSNATLNVKQQRQAQLRGQAAVATLSKEAQADLRAKEYADDIARLRAAGFFLIQHLPLYASAGAILLAGIYFLAYRFSGKNPAILGATATVVAAAAGLLALAGAAMNLYEAEPDLETSYRTMLQSDQTAQILVNTVGTPDGSLVIGDESMLNHLQFVGNYQVYDQRQFTVGYVRSLSPDRFDPTLPNPLQEERAANLFSMVGKYSESQLLTEEHRIVNAALQNGRHVYVVIPLKQLPNELAWYFPASKFKTVKKIVWQEPTAVDPRIARKAHWQGIVPNPRAAQKPADPALWVILEVQSRGS